MVNMILNKLRRNKNTSYNVPTVAKFVIGGMSGVVGQTATHPMDVLKLRMQISKTSLLNATSDILKTDGIRGFYVGLTAALLRQVTYSTTRLGVYTTLLDFGQEQFGRLNYATMVGFGMVSGIIGSFVGTPTDLVLVRMVADVKLPPEKRRNYRNAVTGLMDIWRTEGLTTLWRGAIPTMGRAAIVNGSQLGTYSKSKMMLIDTGYFEEGITLQFIAAMISGLVMCTASLPVDVAKTRIQNWELPTKPPGVIATLFKVARTEGILSLWRGFLPYYSRAGPNTVLTMLCVDQLHSLYIRYMTTDQ